MSEEELATAIQSAQSGNWSAFEKLYTYYRDPLFRYAYWQTGDEAVAEDIVADTLITMLDSLHTFAGTGKFSNWLYTITKRKLSQYYRRKYQEVPIEDTDILDSFAQSELIEPNNEEIKRHFVKSLLSGLSKQEATILRYRYERNLSLSEVAKKLGLTPTQVKVYAHRAKKKVKKALLNQQKTEETS